MKEREAFKFYKSYYSVFKELDKDKDKLAFISALLEKQFDGKEPNLEGMVKFAYISQQHSIDKQVKGWEDKTRCKLGSSNPSKGGAQGGKQAPSQQEEEQEKGQVQEEEKEERTINIEFDLFWNAYQKKTDTAKCKAKWSKLKDEEREKAMSHVPRYVNSTPDKQYRKNPLTYLNGKCWNDEISNEITNNSTKSLTPNDGIERKRYYFKQEQGTFKVMTEQEALDYCEKYATEWWKTEPTQIVDYGN